MAISPRFGRCFARPIVDSWNRNSMIGKARAHLGREVLVCVPHLDAGARGRFGSGFNRSFSVFVNMVATNPI